MLLSAAMCLAIGAFPAKAADFATFEKRVQSGQPVNIVFFGGSLTWGAQSTDPQNTSYRARMAERFAEKYPKGKLRFWDSAIGGTGSQLGIFRLDRDVLARKPDLVFLEFTVNDGAYDQPHPDRLASYEAIVRKLVAADIPVVQVIFPVKPDVLPNPPARPLDIEHKKIAALYHLPSANAVELVQKRVQEGKATPNTLWDNPKDGTHPGDNGYMLYAEAAWNALQSGIEAKTACRVPEKMINADTYMSANRWHITEFPEGWTATAPSRTGLVYDFTPSRWLDRVAMAARDDKGGPSPKPLVLKVRARNVYLFGEANPRTGKYQVTVDGGTPKVYTTYTMKGGDYRYFEPIASDLAPDTDHVIEILPQLDPGQELRFESVCVGGAPATVSVQK